MALMNLSKRSFLFQYFLPFSLYVWNILWLILLAFYRYLTTMEPPNPHVVSNIRKIEVLYSTIQTSLSKPFFTLLYCYDFFIIELETVHFTMWKWKNKPLLCWMTCIKLPWLVYKFKILKGSKISWFSFFFYIFWKVFKKSNNHHLYFFEIFLWTILSWKSFLKLSIFPTIVLFFVFEIWVVSINDHSML